RWERIYFSTLRWFSLPLGRGPKATISFTYCMARLESNGGGTAESDVVAGAALAEATVAVSPVAAVAFFCLEHAEVARIRIKHAIVTRANQDCRPWLTYSAPLGLGSM